MPAGHRAQVRELRDKMIAQGLGHADIAAELARRHGLRPRQAWREAHCLTLDAAADLITGRAAAPAPGRTGVMTASHLSEHERWPGHGTAPAGRKPTLYVLALMAAAYGTAPARLIDTLDRDHLPPADLLLITAYGTTAPAPPAAALELSLAISPAIRTRHPATPEGPRT